MKKLISALLVLAMIFTMIPTLALIGSAEGEGAIVLPGDCFHSRLTYTDNQDGETHTVTCLDCGAVINASQAHTFSNGVCTLCGAEESTAGPTVADDLVFYSTGMSLKDSLTFNFLVRNKVLNNYDSWYVSFTCNDWSTATPVTSTAAGYTAYTSFQKFDFCVYSMQMTDNVTAVIHAFKNNVEYVSAPNVVSVESYVLSKLEAANEATRTLMANLLQYGAMSQTYFEYNTSALANRSLGTYESYVTTTAPTVVDQAASTGTAGAVTLYNTALGLREAVKPQFGVKLPAADTNANYYAIATYGGTTLRIDGENWTRLTSKIFTIYVEGLTAVQGKVPVNVTIYNASTDAAVSQTFTYSIQSHVYKLQNAAGTAEALLNLANALMNYYNAAEVAFAS